MVVIETDCGAMESVICFLSVYPWFLLCRATTYSSQNVPGAWKMTQKLGRVNQCLSKYLGFQCYVEIQSGQLSILWVLCRGILDLFVQFTFNDKLCY